MANANGRKGIVKEVLLAEAGERFRLVQECLGCDLSHNSVQI